MTRAAFIALALLLAGCPPGTWAWQWPEKATDYDHEAWDAVTAEALATWGTLGRRRCHEPRIWWEDERDAVNDACGYPEGAGRWGCYHGQSERKRYVIVWRGHEDPRRLVVWEMTHAVNACIESLPGDRAYQNPELWGPGGFVDRVMLRLSSAEVSWTSEHVEIPRALGHSWTYGANASRWSWGTRSTLRQQPLSPAWWVKLLTTGAPSSGTTPSLPARSGMSTEHATSEASASPSGSKSASLGSTIDSASATHSPFASRRTDP